MKLRLEENFRAVFYTPFYLLKALGTAQRQGLDIEWIEADEPGGAIGRLKRGEVDVTWGGPMRVLKDQDTHAWGDESLVGFCEAVGRDPFCLLGRRALAGMPLAGLAELTLSVTSEVPTPWLCLQADLQDAGVDVGACVASGRVRQGLSFQQQLAALEAGEVDVVQVFEPHVAQLLEAGPYEVLYEASARGPTIYTTFIATRAGLGRHAEAFAALTRAMADVQRWMAEHPDAIAERVAAFFPDVPPSLLEAAARRYVQAGVWSRGTQIHPQGFARLADSLHRGGFIASPGNYSRCVPDL